MTVRQYMSGPGREMRLVCMRQLRPQLLGQNCNSNYDVIRQTQHMYWTINCVYLSEVWLTADRNRWNGAHRLCRPCSNSQAYILTFVDKMFIVQGYLHCIGCLWIRCQHSQLVCTTSSSRKALSYNFFPISSTPTNMWKGVCSLYNGNIRRCNKISKFTQIYIAKRPKRIVFSTSGLK